MTRGSLSRGLTLTLAVTLLGCGSVRPDLFDAPAGGTDAPPGTPDARPIDGPLGQPAPTFTAMTPDWGSTAGGTNVKITGSGFTATNVTVTFGVSKATVSVISDTEIRVVTPSGPHAAVAVKITTDGGSVAVGVPYRYLAPLYAGDGRGGTVGSLYVVDPGTGVSSSVGPINYGVTGLAISPDGILYGATTTNATKGTKASLIQIDPYSGKGTFIGELKDTAGASTYAHDLTFFGARLLGWHKNAMLEINLGTGVSTVSAASVAGTGCGIADAGDGSLIFAPANGNGKLYRVNPANGVATATTTTLNGPAAGVNAITYVGSTAYGSFFAGSGVSLYTINPQSGATALIGALPAQIDAIAGIPTQPPLANIAAAAAPTTFTAPPPPATEVLAPAAPTITVRIAGASRVRDVRDVLAAGHDVAIDGEMRRIVPLLALAPVGQGGRVDLVDDAGAVETVRIDDAGLALAANQRGALKLIDVRAGFHKRFGPIAELRIAP